MASSIVHLAITNELAKRVSFSDTSRLKFGAVVVDAGMEYTQYCKAIELQRIKDSLRQ